MRRPAGVSSRSRGRWGRDEHDEGDVGAETDAEAGDETSVSSVVELALGRARRRQPGTPSRDDDASETGVTREPNGEVGGLGFAFAAGGRFHALGWPPSATHRHPAARITPPQVMQGTPASELRWHEERRWLHSGISSTVWKATQTLVWRCSSLSEQGEGEEEEDESVDE